MDHGIVIWISTTNTNVLQTVVDHLMDNLHQHEFQGSVIGTVEPSVALIIGERRAIEAIKGLLGADAVRGSAFLFRVGEVGHEFFNF